MIITTEENSALQLLAMGTILNFGDGCVNNDVMLSLCEKNLVSCPKYVKGEIFSLTPNGKEEIKNIIANIGKNIKRYNRRHANDKQYIKPIEPKIDYYYVINSNTITLYKVKKNLKISPITDIDFSESTNAKERVRIFLDKNLGLVGAYNLTQL